MKFLKTKYYPVSVSNRVVYDDPQRCERDCCGGKYRGRGTIGIKGERLNGFRCYAEMQVAEPAEGLHNMAQRKAKYGHRAWIVWTDEHGSRHAARATVESLEAAIAAVGPKGKFTGYSGDGIGNILNPGIAQAWLANARIGCLN